LVVEINHVFPECFTVVLEPSMMLLLMLPERFIRFQRWEEYLQNIVLTRPASVGDVVSDKHKRIVGGFGPFRLMLCV
jgi:hypothetical protein